MINTLKWIYRLGYNRGTDRIVRILEQARDFHLFQEQLKQQQEYEDKNTIYKDRPIKPQHHHQRRIAIEDALNTIDPEKYPNIDRFLEMMK